jgi:hypothetical protein
MSVGSLEIGGNNIGGCSSKPEELAETIKSPTQQE